MAKSTTYWHGNMAEYTGKTVLLHGAVFYEIKLTEGHMTGQIKVTQKAPA